MPSLPISFLMVARPDYAEFRRICVDRDMLPIDYDTYINKLNQFSKKRAAQGLTTARINVKPQELVDWCASQGRQVDSNARSAYAAFRNFQLNK